MKNKMALLPLAAMVIVMSVFCSCNNGSKALTYESLNISADDVLALINKQSVSKEEMSALAEKSGMSIVNEIEEEEELPGDWEEGQEAPYQVIYALLSGKGVIQRDCKDEWGERKYSLVENEDRGFGVIIEGESTIEDHNDFILSSIRLAFTFREEANEFEETVEKKGKFALTDDGKQINGAGLILSSYEENKLHWVEIARLIEY